MTMPVTDGQIVVGKFLAALVLLCTTFLFTMPYAFTVATMGQLDWGPVIGGYVGLVLLGGMYAAVGIMVSSWTKDQIVAVLLGFFLCFVLFILDRMFSNSSGLLAQTLEYLSSNYHFQNIARGVIDLKDVVYYMSMTAVALTAAKVTLASRRW
jgi:ABC-2 type transport system permease protein